MPSGRKPLFFIASSWKDLKRLPGPVQDVFGALLLDVQYGEPPIGAKPLKGFGSARVLEIAEDYEGGTYRAVYTVNFPRAVYVLHVFRKKSKRGIATPKPDLDLVRSRLQLAAEHYGSCDRQENRNA